MDWAVKRRLIYIGSIVAIGLVIAFFNLYPKLNTSPTCSDGKQNGTEAGVDCGGSCLSACFFQANDLIVRWTKPFKVSDGLYNAVAYVENQNAQIGIPSIKYEFKLYDEQNVFITRRTGQTFVGPNSRVPILEPGISTGNRIPKRVAFTFLEEPTWIQIDPRTEKLSVSVSDTILSEDSNEPRLEAQFKNDSIYNLTDVSLGVVLYDADGTAIAASKTLVTESKSRTATPVYFTWPEKFSIPVERIEVIPRIDIFDFTF
ncbi:MAG: hypothetical protein MUD00_00240 [Candidatus Pacebacteria bacterium]|nr:hypothetical protein [Candidatus Paceibacterota bacterium]